MFRHNLSIGLKACILGLAIVVLTAVLSGVVISSNNRMRSIVNQMHDKKLQGIYYSGHLQAEALYHFRALYGYIASAGSAGADEKEYFKKGIIEYSEKVRALGLTQEEEKVLEQFTSSWSAYLSAAEKISSLIQAGKNTEAQALATGETASHFERADAALVELVDIKRAAAKQFYNESNTAVTSARNRAIVIIAAGIAMLITVGYLITKSIAGPVTELVASAKKLSSGDLTADIVVRSGDEVGKLAEAFRIMSVQIRDLVRQISLKADLVAASSQELSAASQQATSVSAENSATISKIAATVANVAAGVQQTAASSSKASTAAGDGEKSVLRVAEQMKSITHATEEIGRVINGLSQKSRDINRITGLITEVADQTNMLALNAAIEAARAGEQGRGFAVVAAEVRKLAEQSANAAGEINKLIQDIQNEASEAVGKMEQSGREVMAGTQIAQEVGLSFREITGAVSGLTDRLREISSATREMDAGIQSVSAASEEQSASAEEVAASSSSLAVLAEELNTLVSRFKF